MRILTLAMHVPDSRAAIAVAGDGSGIDRRGVKFVCNPFDEFAVEQAVQLKEQRSDVEEIVAITLGAADAAEALRTALAMGADRGVHLCDDGVPVHDELFKARALAAAIGRDSAGFDLILCGEQTIDNDTGELAPALAEYLDLPHVGAVCQLEVADDGSSVRVHRSIEGAEEVVDASMPVLISCGKGLVEPRYPSLPNLMKAKKKPVEVLTAAEIPELASSAARTTLVELMQLPARASCTMLKDEPQVMARELIRLLHEEAKVI